ncbi:YraN family protein [Otariodibacter sp.]|uniref:YraN family protein n=1 Tax=Otariodibacter sp. TaxID=3030919 RepID=UPI002608278A|nr:YraN family protein [Otariodibacter sp.]
MVQLFQRTNHRKQGAYFEQKARSFLEEKGLTFVAKNQFFRCGELDLVMQEGKTFIFVEVRQRKSNYFGSAVESIDLKKQLKWLKSANLWLSMRNQSLDTADCRFDVVVFEGNDNPIWIKNFLG